MALSKVSPDIEKVVLCYCYCSEQSSNHTGLQVDDVPHGFDELTGSSSQNQATCKLVNIRDQIKQEAIEEKPRKGMLYSSSQPFLPCRSFRPFWEVWGSEL
ncbi:uncharacterized protein [Acropora muricata]|uniref:uncharacterized protein isoform X2 n=1 Tax=Acropora muricata TaxID=159855 RepID=UPI0034E4F14A